MLHRFVCIVAFVPMAVFCQQPTQLTLDQAEALAVKNHPNILAADAEYLKAGQLTVEAKSAYYPSLNGEITGAQANADSRLGAGVLNDPRLFSHFGSGLSLSQLISDFGRTPNLVANSRFNAQARREDSRATRYDVIIGVDQAYYEVLLAQQLIKVSQQTVSSRQTVVDQISELAKNKLKSNLDLSLVQVNLGDAQLMLLRAKDRLAAAYAALAQALGSDQAIEYQLTDPARQPEPPNAPEPLIQDALKNRPEIASLNLQTQADEKMVNAERDLKRPTVALTADAGALPYIDAGNANPNIPTGYEAAAVNVQVPIFNGHLFSARRQAAEYELQADRQRLRAVQERVAKDVRVAWAHVNTAFQAIGTTQQLLDQANMAADLAQGRYQLGLSSVVELTQAQLAQTQAQVENLDAKYEYQEAYAVLRYTLGVLH